MIPNGRGACRRSAGGVDGVGGELGAEAQHREVGGEQAAHPVFFLGSVVVPVPDELTVCALLQNEALLAQTDISSLRILGSGSAPLAPGLLQGWHDRYGIEIINFYGSNEGIAL
jgi:acyl-CoA synthetase (AMP-forming)/AMP-acid ligase II